MSLYISNFTVSAQLSTENKKGLEGDFWANMNTTDKRRGEHMLCRQERKQGQKKERNIVKENLLDSFFFFLLSAPWDAEDL